MPAQPFAAAPFSPVMHPFSPVRRFLLSLLALFLIGPVLSCHSSPTEPACMAIWGTYTMAISHCGGPSEHVDRVLVTQAGCQFDIDVPGIATLHGTLQGSQGGFQVNVVGGCLSGASGTLTAVTNVFKTISISGSWSGTPDSANPSCACPSVPINATFTAHS